MNENFPGVKGFPQLGAALRAIPEKMERNIMRSALNAGAKVIKKGVEVQLRSNGSIKTGELVRGLRTSSRITRPGLVTAKVATGGKHGFIAPWIEFGTAAHRIVAKKAKFLFFGMFAKAIEHPGIRPKPFMRPGLADNAQQATNAVGDYIRKRLTKEGINIPDADLDEGN